MVRVKGRDSHFVAVGGKGLVGERGGFGFFDVRVVNGTNHPRGDGGEGL